MLSIVLANRRRQQKKRRAAALLAILHSIPAINPPRQKFPRFNIEAQTDEQCISLFRYLHPF